MAVLPFIVSASVDFTAQPSSAGEKIIMRSTNAGDTMNATLSGMVSSTPTAETNALLGAREVQTTAAFESLTLGKLASAPTGTVNFYSQGSKASGYIVVNDQPSNNETLTIGLTGFTQVYTFKGTLTPAANEIHIGSDKFETARNICRAINAGTGAGTDYGTGTAANGYVQGYADSAFTDDDLNGTTETTIYIRDRLACARQLTWSVSTTAANLSLAAPTGGSDGTLLFSLTSSTTQISDTMTFYNPALAPDLGTGLLLAATTPTSDALYIGGKSVNVHLRAANYSNAVPVDLEVSDDGVTWASMGITIDNLDNNEQWFWCAPCEYMRLVLATNANTTDVALHAVVISP